MTITIFGAKSMVGLQVIKLALAKGLKVRAFDRNIENLIDADLRDDHFTATKGYVFDKGEVNEVVKNSDAVIFCLDGNINATNKSISLGMKNIILAMEKNKIKRIVALSGIGILNFDEDKLVMDMDDFSDTLKEISIEYLAAFKQLQSSDLAWTLICPSKIIDKDFSGNYSIQENYLNSSNIEPIHAADVAFFMLQCIEQNEYIKKRIGISTTLS